MSIAGRGAVVSIIAVAGAAILLSVEGMAPHSSARRAGCAVKPATLTAPACRLVRSDSASTRNPIALWGEIDCAHESRHWRKAHHGDRHPTATGRRQPNVSFRRLTILEGDHTFGQRCELGRNEHRFGQNGGAGTFQLYREGQRKVTFLSFRILPDTPINSLKPQAVMQMKQTQPSDNGGYRPMIVMNAVDRRWVLLHQDSPGPGQDAQPEKLWSAKARKGRWTRFAFDVTYSQHASRGSLKVFADLNGDGDAGDRKEQSRRFHMPTLKYETPDPNGPLFDVDGLEPGESIPSHLRVGMYQNPEYSCSGINRSRCAIAVDNVQVLVPR